MKYEQPSRSKAVSAVLYGLVSAAGVLTARFANADPPTRDAMRVEGCANGERAPVVERSEVLNEVAREFSRGGRLNEAIDRVGYSAATTTALYVKGPTNDAAIREIIEDRYCTAVTNPPFTEVGVYRRGDEAWIVFAARTVQLAVEDSAAIAAHVLEFVNDARAESRRCGGQRFAAAPPLTLSHALTEAASRHARDMAQHSSFNHRGSDGSQPAQRVSAAGYRWRATGENIAAGQPTAADVVADWLDSPGHCANIMGPQFTEMGVAFAYAPTGNRVVYWAQEFAAPK